MNPSTRFNFVASCCSAWSLYIIECHKEIIERGETNQALEILEFKQRKLKYNYKKLAERVDELSDLINKAQDPGEHEFIKEKRFETLVALYDKAELKLVELITKQKLEKRLRAETHQVNNGPRPTLRRSRSRSRSTERETRGRDSSKQSVHSTSSAALSISAPTISSVSSETSEKETAQPPSKRSRNSATTSSDTSTSEPVTEKPAKRTSETTFSKPMTHVKTKAQLKEPAVKSSVKTALTSASKSATSRTSSKTMTSSTGAIKKIPVEPRPKSPPKEKSVLKSVAMTPPAEIEKNREPAAETQAVATYAQATHAPIVQEITTAKTSTRINLELPPLQLNESDLTVIPDCEFEMIKEIIQADVISTPMSVPAPTASKSINLRPEPGALSAQRPRRSPIRAATPAPRSAPYPERTTHRETGQREVEKEPCAYCKDPSHPMQHCTRYQNQSLVARIEVIERLHLCKNCLGRHHLVHCRSTQRCKKQNCNQPHHTLIHPGTA